jgi:hypothetical protein
MGEALLILKEFICIMILDIYLKTNPKGVDIMCEEMEKMIDEVEKRTTYINNLEAIRHIMEGLKFTAQQAMDLLKIPAAEQEKYIAKL